MAKRDVNILIQARDEATAIFEKVATGAKAFGSDLERISAESLRDLGKGLTDAQAPARSLTSDFERYGGLLFKAFTYMSAMQGAFGVMTASSQALKRDWEGAAATIKTLPLGIGAAARATDTWLRHVTGLDKVLADIEKRTDAAASHFKDSAAAFARSVADIERVNSRAINDLMLGAAQGFEQQREQVRQQLEAMLADVVRAADGRVTPLIAETMDNLQRLYKQKIDAINAEEDAALAEQARSAAKRLAEVDSQIRQTQLQIEGRGLDARLEQIRHHYQQQIDAAREANDAELADRLKMLRDLAMEEAGREKTVQENRFGGNVTAPAFSRMLSGVAELRGIDAPLRSIEHHTQRQTTLLTQMKDALAELARGGGGGVTLTPAGLN